MEKIWQKTPKREKTFLFFVTFCWQIRQNDLFTENLDYCKFLLDCGKTWLCHKTSATSESFLESMVMISCSWKATAFILHISIHISTWRYSYFSFPEVLKRYAFINHLMITLNSIIMAGSTVSSNLSSNAWKHESYHSNFKGKHLILLSFPSRCDKLRLALEVSWNLFGVILSHIKCKTFECIAFRW